MKKTSYILLTSLLVTVLSGCSNFNDFIQSGTFYGINKNSANPLKSQEDNRIEKILVGGKWLYQRQPDDCKDTYWAQHFYKNGYYKSGGATCLLSDTFSVDAEAWHVKDQILYIINLSPRVGEDIILKYGVEIIDKNRIILRSAENTYTFIKHY